MKLFGFPKTLAKKTIVHTLRVILISKDILENNTITDFTLAIDHHYTMQGMFYSDWTAYTTLFEPIVAEALQELKDLC